MSEELRNKLSELLAHPEMDERELRYRAGKLLNESSESTLTESKDLTGLMKHWIQSKSENKDKLIQTGFKSLDEVIGGFSPGEFIVIGSRPAMGKTQLMINLTAHIAQTHPVLYLTFDASEFLLTQRFASYFAGQPTDSLSDEQLQTVLLNKPENQTTLNNILISSSGQSSISRLKTHIQKETEEKGIRVVFIDYLQLLSSGNRRLYRTEEISRISRELKILAKELNICIVLASQLSRMVETRGGDLHPRLSDLRDSGAIEEDADKVMFVFRAEYYGIQANWENESTDGIIDLILAKNRNGKTDTIKLMRDKHFIRIADYNEDPIDILTNRLKELIKPGRQDNESDFPF